MLNYFIVGLGGFTGALSRYLIGKIPLENPTAFPVNTFLINIIGAFAIGCIAAFAAMHDGVSPRLILFLKTGVCGGFTTFSTFSLEAYELIKAGAALTAFAYVISSAVLGISAVFLAEYMVND